MQYYIKHVTGTFISFKNLSNIHARRINDDRWKAYNALIKQLLIVSDAASSYMQVFTMHSNWKMYHTIQYTLTYIDLIEALRAQGQTFVQADCLSSCRWRKYGEENFYSWRAMKSSLKCTNITGPFISFSGDEGWGAFNYTRHPLILNMSVGMCAIFYL